MDVRDVPLVLFLDGHSKEERVKNHCLFAAKLILEFYALVYRLTFKNPIELKVIQIHRELAASFLLPSRC